MAENWANEHAVLNDDTAPAVMADEIADDGIKPKRGRAVNVLDETTDDGSDEIPKPKRGRRRPKKMMMLKTRTQCAKN